jgi:hypothetical protein
VSAVRIGASLVVNKRKLPFILRSNVPPLRVAGTAIEPLVAAPNRLWGVLHSSVGKQIQHRQRAVTILSVHQNTRLVAPVGNEDGAFWIPRRTADRKRFNIERMWRSRRRLSRDIYGSPCCYTGEPRPLADSVPVENIYKDISPDTLDLLFSLGRYENCLILRSSWGTRMMSVFTRLDNLKRLLQQLLNKATKDFTENLVVETLRCSQMDEHRIAATYDVLVGGVALHRAARDRGLQEGHLRQAVNRVKRKVRPLVLDQLRVWAGQADAARTTDEIDALRSVQTEMLAAPPERIAAC